MPGAFLAAPFIAVILVLVTVPHHRRIGNFATLSIIAWLALYELIQGVNAVIWRDNVDVRAPVWCDITTKIQIGAEVGLPGCCLCLSRRLYRVVSGYELCARGWKERISDVLICWVIPIFVMGLHVIVQGHRFNIIESIGCQSATYVSLPSVLILHPAKFVSGLLSPIYCILTIRRLYMTHNAIPVMRKASKSHKYLTVSRLVRLSVLTLVVGSCTAVFISLQAVKEWTHGLLPWKSWDSVHADFAFVGQFPLHVFPGGELEFLFAYWWAWPLGSLMFFAFFGVGEEAMRDYRKSAAWVRQVLSKRQLAASELHDEGGTEEDEDEEKVPTGFAHLDKPLPPTPLPLIV